MILKARFSVGLDNLTTLLTKYTELNGGVKFLTCAGLCSGTSEIVGKQNEIMFFIGFVAGLGVHTLENVSKV